MYLVNIDSKEMLVSPRAFQPPRVKQPAKIHLYLIINKHFTKYLHILSHEPVISRLFYLFREQRHREKASLLQVAVKGCACKDILNVMRGYPQQPATISSTDGDDILARTAGSTRKPAAGKSSQLLSSQFHFAYTDI